MSHFGRSAREQREYEKVVYPSTSVYANRLDIRQSRLLETAERMLVAKRPQQGLPPQAHPRSVAGLRAIHHHLFQDIYGWAGEFRRNTTARDPAPFCIARIHRTRTGKALCGARRRELHQGSRSRSVLRTSRLLCERDQCHSPLHRRQRTSPTRLARKSRHKRRKQDRLGAAGSRILERRLPRWLFWKQRTVGDVDRTAPLSRRLTVHPAADDKAYRPQLPLTQWQGAGKSSASARR